MKKWRVAIIIGILLGVAGSGFYVWKTRYSKPVVSSIDQQLNTNSSPLGNTLIWEDPAGFRFSYAEGLEVDPHPEDKQNYAHVEFTSAAHPGHVIVWAKDLPAGNQRLEAWVKANKSYAGATIVDSTFVGEPAKKILLATTPPQRHVVSYADDLLFIIEASLEDAEYWSAVADGIVDSFAIVPPEAAAAGGQAVQDTSDYIPADEEEIIE
jgi:hypothetical protein